MNRRAFGLVAVVFVSAAMVGRVGADPSPPRAARSAARQSFGTSNDHGLFLNILPAGQGHSISLSQAVAYEVAGRYPPNETDQLGMYNRLPVSVDKVTDHNLTDFYKPETFRVGSK